jgi:Integrase core domain/GAG-pre-integrase domain
MQFRPCAKFFATSNACSASVSTSKLELWHQRCGHINVPYLKNTAMKNAAKGLQKFANDNTNLFCQSCQIGKQARKPYLTVEPKRESKPGEITHADLSGKMPTPSLAGSKYFLLIKDQATGFRTVYFLHHKSEAADCLQTYKNFVDTRLGIKMKVLKTDGGGEFINHQLDDFCEINGISHEVSPPYCPQANGRIEREMRTIKNSARCMMLAKNLPEVLWAEAVAASVYIHNRILDKQSPDVTAYEQFFNNKPSLRHLRIWGSDAYVHVPDQKRQVWDA